jgi:hypothetical protein
MLWICWGHIYLPTHDLFRHHDSVMSDPPFLNRCLRGAVLLLVIAIALKTALRLLVAVLPGLLALLGLAIIALVGWRKFGRYDGW